jgi:hypothetical protein
MAVADLQGRLDEMDGLLARAKKGHGAPGQLQQQVELALAELRRLKYGDEEVLADGVFSANHPPSPEATADRRE